MAFDTVTGGLDDTAQGGQEPATGGTTDTGTATYDTYAVQPGDALELYAMNLWLRNPELQERFPARRNADGSIRMSDRGFPILENLRGPGGLVMYFVEYNNNLPADQRPEGWMRITDRFGRNCDGSSDRSPQLNRGQVFVYPELPNEILNPGVPCRPITELPPERPTPRPPAPPAPPAPPQAEIELVNPQYRGRRATGAADGRFVTPDTNHGSYEHLAQTGLNPAFSRQWYALQDVAARMPVIFASHSGQRNPDHLLEGDRLPFTEDGESRRDDGYADRVDGINGGRQNAFIAGYMDFVIVAENGVRYVQNAANPTERVRESEFPGLSELNLPVGTQIRHNGGIWEFAHGGDYPLPVVGALFTAPSTQEPFDAEQSRYGLTQNVLILSHEDFYGRDTITRDTRAEASSPLETSDRVNAMTAGLNAQREFRRGMNNFRAATDAQSREDAAVLALTAHRDFGNNMLIRQVDSRYEQLEADERAIENFFASEGVDLARVRARVAAAEPLPIRFMDQATMDTLQDYSPENPQYTHLRAGEVIPGSPAILADAYRDQTLTESVIARGRAQELSETDMIAASRGAWQSITANPEAVRAIGAGMQTNPELALEFGEGLTDMLRNPQNYGFRDRREAREFVVQFVGDNEEVRRDVLNNGSTQWIVDRPDNMQDPRSFGQVAGAIIQQNPALFTDAMNRMTDPALPGELSDGRSTGVALLRALGQERGATPDAMGPTYTAIVSAPEGVSEEHGIRNTIASAGLYANQGASGVSVNGFQRLDNLYVAAQYGALAAQGQPYLVATDADIDSGAARARAQELFPGQRVRIFNTGAFDGSAIYEAARRGDNDAVYHQLFMEPGAVAANSDSVAVQALQTRPVLGREAVTAAILRDPSSLDGPIARLRSYSTTTRGGASRYDELADALERAQRAAEEYQRTGDPAKLNEVGVVVGRYFREMEFNARSNGGAWRDNAWRSFIDAAGQDDRASAALLAAIEADPEMRNALTAGLPDALVQLDASRGTNRGKLGDNEYQLPANQRGDALYQPSLFTTPEEPRGWHIGGRFRLFDNGANAVTVNLDTMAAAAGRPIVEQGGRGRGRGEAAVAAAAAASQPVVAETPTPAAQQETGGTPAVTGAPVNGGNDSMAGLSAEARAAALAAGNDAAGSGVNASAAVLGVEPRIILSGDGTNPVAALAARFQASGTLSAEELAAVVATIPPAQLAGLSEAEVTAAAYQALAAQALNSGMLSVTSGDQIAASLNVASITQNNSLTAAAESSTAVGVLHRALLLVFIRDTEISRFLPGDIDGCPGVFNPERPGVGGLVPCPF